MGGCHVAFLERLHRVEDLLFHHAAQQEEFVLHLLDFGFEGFSHRSILAPFQFCSFMMIHTIRILLQNYPNRPVT